MKKNFIKSNLKPLLTIAVPLMLSNLISQLQMFIDRVFLGHADVLYMSALGNASSPIWTTMSFCFSLSIGASVLISQAVGSKDDSLIEMYSGSLAVFSNIVPFCLFILWFFFPQIVFRAMGASERIMGMCIDYARFYAPTFLWLGISSTLMVIFQTSNHTQPMVWYGIIRSTLNIILDWILIFGKMGLPAMGIKGAAIGTTIAEFIGLLYIVAETILDKNLFTKPSLRSIKKAKIKNFLYSAKLGLNSAFEDLLWNLGNLILIRMLNDISELGAAIYSIIFGIETIAVVLIGSLGNGTMTLSSEAWGSRNKERFSGVCRTAIFLSFSITVLSIILSLSIPRQIISLFTSDETVVEASVMYLLLISVNLFGKSTNIITGNSIRGTGDMAWMLKTQIFGTVFVVSVAYLFVYVMGMGMTGVFIAVLFDELTRGIINSLRVRHIIKIW